MFATSFKSSARLGTVIPIVKDLLGLIFLPENESNKDYLTYLQDMKKFYLLLLLLLGTVFSLMAQEHTLKGRVVSGDEQKPLPGANAILYNSAREVVKAIFSNEEGFFELRVNRGAAYTLKISFVGYQTLEKPLFLAGEATDLGSLVLLPDNQTLKTIEVQGQAVPTIQKGDTTEYNALAYKTNPDASAEDLIQKMPGVVVQNGTVQAQGENVRQVLVDGKPFFSDDPNLALRNLPAEMIDKIQVFDQASDQAQFTGFDDGQNLKTINIITKPDKSRGEFGKVYGGYGQNHRYLGGGSANVFRKESRFSLIGQSNNINVQNFSAEDLLGVVNTPQNRGGNFGGGRFRLGGGGTDASDFLVGNQSGITTTHALGLNYSDNWGKDIETSGFYFFNRSQNETEEQRNEQIFLGTNETQFYNEDRLSNQQNNNHRLSFNFEYRWSPRTSLITRTRFSTQSNQSVDESEAFTLLANQLLNQNENLNNREGWGYNFSNNLLLRHRFAKIGRTLSLNFNTLLNQQESDGTLSSENTSFEEESTTQTTISQQNDRETFTRTFSTNLIYTEPLSRTWFWMSNAQLSFQHTDSEQNTFQFEESTQDYSTFLPTLSNAFESLYRTLNLGSGLRFRKKTWTGMLRLNYQWAFLDNETVFPSPESQERDFHNVLPSVMLNWRGSSGKNLRIFYRTSTQVPSVAQLQAVINNQNPLQVSVGNPALLQEYQHRWVLRYAGPNPEKSRTLFFFLGGSYTQHYIGTETWVARADSLVQADVVLARGGQITSPVNLNGYWNLRSLFTYGLPLKALKSNLNLNLSLAYLRTPGLINGQSNFANNPSLGLGLVLSSNISPNVDFTLSVNPAYNWVRNTLQTDLNNRFLTLNSSIKFTGITPGGWVLRSELNQQWFDGLAEGFDQSFWLWNMSVGKKFFKKQQGELSVQVFDLLNQNNNIQRNVSEVSIEDVRTNVLPRYFLLKFEYTFRNFTLKK
ncbi:MAG: TonB-dependent receptor [Microscillaceae bacterium]